jgi:hypothetical protein
MGEESSYIEFVDSILRPPVLTTLRNPSQNIRVKIQRPDQSVDEFVVDDIYPFHTVADLCSRIYVEKGERDEYHPRNQCLLLQDRTGRYTHLQYIFNNISLLMLSPYQRMVAEPDGIFVDLTGNVKIASIVPRHDMLLEKTLFTTAKEEYVVHLFIYRDIIAAYPGERPIARIDWEGKIKTYFPEYEKEYEDGSIPIDVQEFTPTRIERFRERTKLINVFNELLDSKPLRVVGESRREEDINVSNIRHMRIGWRRSKVPFQLESLFYDISVGELVPYVRFYPKSNTPISKVYVTGPDNIPNLPDPTVLVQWAGIRSITPEEDLLMMKVLVRKANGSVPPIYATFYVFEDGSAKWILQPSATEKSLSGDVDLVNLPDTLQTFFASLPKLQPFVRDKDLILHPYTPKNASLEDAYMVLSIWLESSDAAPITYKRLNKVLPYFRAFFQETSSPIKEQRPIMFLRYRCVNDFRTPSRESQFLQRIIDLQKVAGKASIVDMEKYFREEFNVSEQVAKQRVNAFIDDMSKFAMVNPEIREVTQLDNPGIDVAIFGKHPFYTFHIYRVDSLETLQRIKTLLSLLITVDQSDLVDMEEAAEVMDQEEEAEEASADADASANASTNANAKPSNSFANREAPEDLGFELDALGELPDFEEGEPLQTLVQKDVDESQQERLEPAQRGKEVEEEEEEEGEGEVSAKTYFSRRLRKYDSALFKYGKAHKSTKSYPQQCQANALKQPAVLNEGEYRRMKDLYKTDVAEGRLQWVEYPLKEGSTIPIAVPKKKGVVAEKVTVLRYGTNLDTGKANIYTCSEYWCMFDEVILLKTDFNETRARDIRTGEYKEEGTKLTRTCPFCKRGPVMKRDKISPGESVIQRTPPKTHAYIGFLGKGNPTHPKGFHLPCCFIKDKPIFTTNPAFVTEGPEDAPVLSDSGPMTYNYEGRISSLKNVYITGPDKLPLEYTPGHGPQIGMLPAAADAYFRNPELVKQDHTFWKIILDNTTREPSVSGFFRVAVENRQKYEADSFFAAVAPFYGYTGADQLKERLYEVITPRIFMSLNYGNFLFEFYNPAYEISETLPLSQNKGILIKFIKQLGIKTAFNTEGLYKEAVVRAVKGYLALKGPKAFEEYKAFGSYVQDEAQGKLFDRSVLKECRQYYSLFTLPNVMTWKEGSNIVSNGVLFIILEIDEKGALQVKCPPYGMSRKMAEVCDVAFLLHYKQAGIWEPVFYSHNDVSKNVHYTTMIFSRRTYADWPLPVKQRADEFYSKCGSTGLGIYTESPHVESSTLIPLSEAMSLQVPGADAYAILRDSYNHVSAVLFEENGSFIYLPVIDDGSVYPDTTTEMTWRHFMKRLAKADVVEAFYKKLDPLFDRLPATVRPMYERAKIIRLDKTAPAFPDLYALHLRGGLFVPVVRSEGMGDTGIEKGQELPWMVDSAIVYQADTKTVQTFMDSKDFEEIYQHLRYTFSNWLATVEGSVVKEINEILYDRDGNLNLNLSVAEKRMRLFIKIGRTVLGWLDSSIPQVGVKPTLKRMDCRILQDAESCNNKCVWKQESSQCLIHVPKEYTVGRTSVGANGFMVKKLIEELVRFPIKRRELLMQRVRQYVTLRAPFRSGDSYIVPEYLPQWSELLRMDWMKKKVETPKYIEEFSWSGQADAQDEEQMPEELRLYMGPKWANFFFLPQFEGTVRDGYLELGVDTGVSDPLLTKEAINALIPKLRLSICQLDFEPDSLVPSILGGRGLMRGFTDCVVSAKLPDTTIGFISRSPDKIVAIPYNDLPDSMKKGLQKAGNPIRLT